MDENDIDKNDVIQGKNVLFRRCITMCKYECLTIDYIPLFDFSVSVKHQTTKSEKDNSTDGSSPNINDCLCITVNL